MQQQNESGVHRRRIGILGGTFDPPHRGHVNVAVNAVTSGAVDEVWMMVSPENPFKRDMERTSAAIRVVMCRILVRSLEQEDRVRVSDFELSLPLPSYMINTLTALRREYADHDFKLIIGADNLDDFDKWRESDRIKREFGLIVYPRDNDMAASDTLLAGTSGANPERTSLSECPGYPTERNSDNCIILKDAPRVTVSSTYLRQLARRQSSGDFSSGPDELSLLTSPELAAYIRSEKLYGSTK